MQGISLSRRVLLVEISRRCQLSNCNERVFIGLTKQEALEYTGFECRACERWNDDSLTRTEIPEWWDELTIHASNTEN